MRIQILILGLKGLKQSASCLVSILQWLAQPFYWAALRAKPNQKMEVASSVQEKDKMADGSGFPSPLPCVVANQVLSVLSNFHFSFVCTIFFKVQLRNKLFFLVLKRVLRRRALKNQYGGQRAGGQSGNVCKCWKDLVIVYMNLRRNKK